MDEGGGSGGGGLSSSTRTLSDANSDDADFWKPGAQIAQADGPPQYRIDLLEHEGRGGAHTIKEHIAKDDAYLLARTRGERGPHLIRKRVGSFPSLEAANKLVSATLASTKRENGQVLSNRERVERVARGEVGGDFITLEFNKQTGREAFAPSELAEPYLRDTYGVGVVIVHDKTSKTGFTVFNAYPRNPD